MIASIPVREGLDAAREVARQASDAGIADVGVLNTARTANLRRGSFIVLAGSYRTSDGALDALAHLTGLYPRAYVHGLVRRISRPGRRPVGPPGARHVPGTAG